MRVLSLHPAATEIMFAIGAGGQLVGRTESCDYPEAALKVPSMGRFQEPTPETVSIFEPDLVLTGRGQDELAKQLSASFSVFHFSPKSIEDLFTLIADLAQRTEKQVEAEMTLHDLMTSLENIKEKSQKFRKVRVYFEVNHSPPKSANCYLSEIVAIAGGVLFKGEPTPENLQVFNPQFIIASKPGAKEQINSDILLARDGWQKLNAVTYERVFVLDEHLLYRPGPRLVEGIQRLAMILHGITARSEWQEVSQ